MNLFWLHPKDFKAPTSKLWKAPPDADTLDEK